MEYIASPEFGRERAMNKNGGYVSPNRHVDSELYTTEVDRRAAAFLNDEADIVRYDASDLMPGAVGTDLIWDVAVDITRGEVTVEDGFAQIERSWPSG
jgi:alpha-glucoside transport system substrate-binding protein